jgi:hypothetical protein
MSSDWWKKLKDFVGQLDEEFTPADQSAEKRPQKWNDFLIQIAREIEQVMLAEMLEPPGEPTYIPPEYIVFISPVDDAGLQGDKRVGFLRGLRNITAQRAKEIVGAGKLQTDKFFIEFRVDGNLAEGQFYVKPSWDVEHEPTRVVVPKFAGPPPAVADDEATHVLAQDEETDVHTQPLFCLRVTREGEPEPKLYPFFKAEISIGRGGKNVSVDVVLPEDREISRLHALVRRTPEGFLVIMRGKNPMFVGERELHPGEEVMVGPGESIRIGSYRLSLGKE